MNKSAHSMRISMLFPRPGGRGEGSVGAISTYLSPTRSSFENRVNLGKP